jgi:hypothetical protein
MFIPDLNNVFPSGSRVKKIPAPDPHQRIYVILTQKTVSKLSENGLGSSSRTPDPDFFTSRIRILDSGVKKHRIPYLDPQHWEEVA